MLKHRVVPCLLLKDRGLVKTTRFSNPIYVGDPVNAIRIFNDKEVDELMLLDIDASVIGREPDYELIKEVAGECFMPLCYGGGISSLSQARKIFSSGVEKIVINTAASKNPALITEISEIYGNQAVVCAVDYKRTLFGKYTVMARSGKESISLNPVAYAQQMENAGAGEIMLNSIDRDGTQEGYDIDFVSMISNAVSIPIIACGGAGKISDFSEVIKRGKASAVAAGSLFVFHGKRKAVLINYPSQEELASLEE